MVVRRWALVSVLGFALVPVVAQAQVLSGKLAFVATQPCRLVDTRNGPPLVAGAARNFNVVGTTGFVAQGGLNGGCAIPGYSGGRPRVQAVALNLVAVQPQGPGHLVAWPPDQAQPLASVLNYASAGGLNIANGVILPLAQDGVQGADLRVQAAVSAVHLVIDAVGYFTRSARKYCLTQALAQAGGADADDICPGGFHMATLWEIHDTSNLEYDNQSGSCVLGAGEGPALEGGWVHGLAMSVFGQVPGYANCQLWTSNSGSHYGSWVALAAQWDSPPTPISPWAGSAQPCNYNAGRTWCVED